VFAGWLGAWVCLCACVLLPLHQNQFQKVESYSCTTVLFNARVIHTHTVFTSRHKSHYKSHNTYISTYNNTAVKQRNYIRTALLDLFEEAVTCDLSFVSQQCPARLNVCGGVSARTVANQRGPGIGARGRSKRQLISWLEHINYNIHTLQKCQGS
jgi:hypothetical protein